MNRIALIRTSASAERGSMSAYADMARKALAVSAGGRIEGAVCEAFPSRGGSMWRQHLWRLVFMAGRLRRAGVSWCHLLDGSMLAFMPRDTLAHTLVTVHDLIPWLQLRGELPGRPSRAAAWVIRRSLARLRHVAGVCTDSERTARDVRQWTLRADVVTIPLATRSLPAARQDIGVPERFILHVGHQATYKNRMGVLRVFARLSGQPDLWLMMAGPPPDRSLRKAAEDIGRIRFLPDATDEQLATLYQQAVLLLFPSLYEGFGMPVREAQAAGCPVVCSTAASLPEVAAGAALMADAADEKGLARHCRALLTDEALRERLIKQGRRVAAAYTIERMGASLVDWYRQVWQTVGKRGADAPAG